SIEKSLQLVRAVDVARAYASFFLIFDRLFQVVVRETGEVGVNQFGTILFAGVSEGAPGQPVIANNIVFGQILDFPGSDAAGVQGNARRGRSQAMRDEFNESEDHSGNDGENGKSMQRVFEYTGPHLPPPPT